MNISSYLTSRIVWHFNNTKRLIDHCRYVWSLLCVENKTTMKNEYNLFTTYKWALRCLRLGGIRRDMNPVAIGKPERRQWPLDSLDLALSAEVVKRKRSMLNNRMQWRVHDWRLGSRTVHDCPCSLGLSGPRPPAWVGQRHNWKLAMTTSTAQTWPSRQR